MSERPNQQCHREVHILELRWNLGNSYARYCIKLLAPGIDLSPDHDSLRLGKCLLRTERFVILYMVSNISTGPCLPHENGQY